MAVGRTSYENLVDSYTSQMPPKPAQAEAVLLRMQAASGAAPVRAPRVRLVCWFDYAALLIRWC